MDFGMIVWSLTMIVLAMGGILTTCAYLIYVERKLSAYMQDRIGPNRVGPLGLLQPLADGLKFILKEDIFPANVDRTLFLVAPAIAVLTTLLCFAVIPFGPTSINPDDWQIVIAPGVDIGVLYVFAVSSLAVYAVILGGWASNNKYSLLGALRSSAQVVSYEIPLGLSILGVLIMVGSLNLEDIIHDQAAGTGIFGWYIWSQPLAGLIFLISAMAESNRLPFDLPECEQELVGGYHTEYSAMKFAMFFLAEYTHIITISFLTTILFFGGWAFPFIATTASSYPGVFFVKWAILLTKVLCVIIFVILIRWTIPRFRFDQLMVLSWKVLIPLGIANLVIVMFVKEFGLPVNVTLFPASIGLLLLATVISARSFVSRQGRTIVPTEPKAAKVAAH